MYQIEIGDKVKHKTNIFFNSLDMTVTDIDNGKIYCDYFDSTEKKDKISPPFDADELQLIKKIEGGFTA